jgi:DNA modification methylase
VTKPGELVLDPCCGQATTGEAALLEGRRFLGVDSDAGALALATKRLQGL